jgi:ESF2/ABP1 family protein
VKRDIYSIFIFWCGNLAHEAAIHAAKLRVELSQSKTEQQEYLKNVELARVLDKRAKRKTGKKAEVVEPPPKGSFDAPENESNKRRKQTVEPSNSHNQLDNVLGSIF